MKKLIKIIQKVLFSVVCFSLMTCIYFVLSPINASATPPTFDTPKTAYVSVYTPLIGKKVLLRDTPELFVTVGVRNEEETKQKDALLRFSAGSSDFDFHSSPAGGYGNSLPVLAYSFTYIDSRYVDEKAYICWYNEDEGTDDFFEFDENTYVQSFLFRIYEHGTDNFTRITEPKETDAYGELVHKTFFYVNLKSLAIATAENLECGSIGASVTTGYNLEDREQGGRSGGFYYATDGEYVAFSDASEEDAKAILTGIPVGEPPEEPSEEPKGFFSGCN